MCLGQCPILSLSEARDKALELKKLAVSGRGPRSVSETIKSLTLDECVAFPWIEFNPSPSANNLILLIGY